jgi:hypothetical protein
MNPAFKVLLLPNRNLPQRRYAKVLQGLIASMPVSDSPSTPVVATCSRHWRLTDGDRWQVSPDRKLTFGMMPYYYPDVAMSDIGSGTPRAKEPVVFVCNDVAFREQRRGQ